MGTRKRGARSPGSLRARARSSSFRLIGTSARLPSRPCRTRARSTTFTVSPKELFEFDYPAPGDPDLALEVAEVVKPHWMGLDRDQWGLDHGTWSVLAHMYPDADVQVVQLSINALRPLEYHVELAARLQPLRDRGVMILASGNVVHNLRRVQWDLPDAAFDWAERFDHAAVEQLATAPGNVMRLAEHPDYDLAVPTPDHFIPLLYLAALAAEEGASVQALIRGYALGSISMTCYGLGANVVLQPREAIAAGVPEGMPPDQTNM